MLDLNTLRVPYLYPSYLSSSVVRTQPFDGAVIFKCADHVYDFFKTIRSSGPRQVVLDEDALLCSEREYFQEMSKLRLFLDTSSSKLEQVEP